MSLQLDTDAQAMVGELLDELENDEGCFRMTTRLAALIDAKLNDGGYIGIVTWFSEEDYIEHEIQYS
ncbi:MULTISPECIES: hypothetical protein [unclassified Vibrio]|uniref:hypothetical protein n=1 Tax=unclassified Vibrio TaxID=2614977 RepID=UPI001E378BC2|nr:MULTISPECIES: hypothetical protein [unclassified Vibrio]